MEERYVCPIYKMHVAYLWSSGRSVLYIGCMVPICVGAVRLSYIYRMHGAYVGRSGTFVLYIGCMVAMWGGAIRLSYI